MLKLSYDSVDELIEAQTRDLLPALRLVKMMAESGKGRPCPPNVYKNACRLIKFLENPKALREYAEKMRTPDGRVEVEGDY